ncbi:MAG: hypothetical protein EBU33_09060, partial [Sphingobacteriia bacterium]|nr:hypothetical protein [Sphingobacteriia bacterium]
TRRYEFMLHPHERDEDMLAPEMVQHLMDTHEAAPQSVLVQIASNYVHLLGREEPPHLGV